MALRGKNPAEVQKRLKMFIYGASGVGKTTTAISFPNCYLIDTEHGAENSQYGDLLKKNNGMIFQTSDFKEILQEVRTLRTEEHNFKTLIIDPMTVVYNNWVDHNAVKNGKDNTEYGKNIVAAKKDMKRFFDLLLDLDMNIILTAHAKKEYAEGSMTVKGRTFDFFEGAEYVFDLVLEIQKIGKKRIGKVIKTRIKTFEEGEEFDWSYETIVNKYDRDIMEAPTKPVVVATPEELAQLNHLISILKISNDEVGKWLKKAKVEVLEDMPQELIAKYIQSLEDRINAKSN